MTSEPGFQVLQGMAYAAFAVWVMIAIRRDLPIASCGCLGRDDTPPYWGHFLLDLVGAGVSFGAAISSEVGLVGSGPMVTAAQLAIVVTGAFLGWVILGDGARLAGATKR